MRQVADILVVPTPGRGMHEVTGEIAAWAQAQGMTAGVLTVFCRHPCTSPRV